MPFDSNGNYTLPAIYVAENGTTVEASQHNTPLEDLRSALNSLVLRTGVAPMSGPLAVFAGTIAAPGIAFNGDATRGWYKTATGWAFAIGGVKVFEIAAGGATLANIDIVGATAAAIAVDDVLPFYDLSDTANKKIAGF